MKINIRKVIKVIAIILIAAVVLFFAFAEFLGRNLDNLDVADFKFLNKGISYRNICMRVGAPDNMLQGYGYELIYDLKDKSKVRVWIHPETLKLQNATLVHPDGTKEILVK